MEPNKDYWNKDRIPKARIVFDNIISRADAIASVAAGDGKIDVVSNVTVEEAKAFKSEKAKIVANNSKTVLAGVINQKKGGPLADVAVRKALNMAIDKDAVVKDGLGGYGSVIAAMIQPGRVGANASLKPYAYDPAAAKAVLEKAGVKAVTIKGGSPAIVASMAASLAKAGVAATAFAGKDDSWDINLVEHFDWSPGFAAGVVYREFFATGGGFLASDPATFDALYAKALANPDPAAQAKVMAEMEQWAYDTAPAVFLGSPNQLYAVSNRVKFTPYETWMLELAETSVAAK
jgi:peptide/nickel transport system substrate-binding protein